MNSVRLNKSVTLSVEPYNRKLRFVVNVADTEWVCRIERKKAIETFLQTSNTSIFKGRLQLHKTDDEIAVEVKGEVIGHLPLTVFKELTNYFYPSNKANP